MLEQAKQEIVTLSAGGTVEVHIETLQGKFGKTVVLEAMKSLQKEGKGTLVVGRHGHSTRFRLGATQVDQKVIILAMGLEAVIQKNVASAPPGTDLVINLEDLEKQFNKSHLVSAFRILEEKKLGVFTIGRKGAKTRFEIGKTREQKALTSSNSSGESFSLPPPEDGPFANVPKYVKKNRNTDAHPAVGFKLLVSNGLVFTQMNVPEGHATLRAAFDAAGLREIAPGGFERFEKVASRFGFVLMQPVGISK
jgi:hypothetical protein